MSQDSVLQEVSERAAKPTRIGCVPADTRSNRPWCPPGHVQCDCGLFPFEIQAAHDLEQARMIGQTQLLCRAGDVPIMPFQGCNHDLTLGLSLEGGEAS